jgi:ATP-dependent helicase/nuclease subunit B
MARVPQPKCWNEVTVEILLAPAGGGKTAHAISRIRELRASDPLAPIWVALPNQPQVAAFRQRLARAGGALNVEAGTFYRLYADVLARADAHALSTVEGPTPRLFDAVQHRLLRTIVDRLCAEGHLRHYAPLRDKPGFIRALRTLIQELKRARVHRDDFAAAASQPPRLSELAAVYAAYQDWLVTSGWTDAEGQGWLTARALECDPSLYADLALLVVDGFDEFNPTQLEVLRLLASRASDVMVTLTGEPTRPDRIAHRRFARARAALVQALAIEPKSLPEKRQGDTEKMWERRDSSLTHVEATLFEPNPSRLPADAAVAFVEAQNRRQEVRTALRWLKARIVQDGMAPRQVALLARDLGPYRPFLEETAVEFGLPLHIAVGADLSSNPAIAALLPLLSLPVLDWPRRPVIEALTSPYFDWSTLFQEEELPARLDAASRAGLVIQGLGQWREALDRLAEATPEVGAESEEEDVTYSDLPSGEEAVALRRAFERFVARLTPPPQALVCDCAAWVEGLVGDDPALTHPLAARRDDDSLRVVARARGPRGRFFAERDVAALRAFKDVLRGLVLAESLLEKQPAPVTYARFFSELSGAVEAATYAAPPLEEESILVAPVFHARGLSFRAVAILGLSEGEFPAAEREDPLLREEDRALLREQGLPLEPRLRGEEATLFYEATTRARERLLLCRPYLADDRQAWEPSPYWYHVQRLVDAPLRRVRPSEIAPDEAASTQELVAALAISGVSPAPQESGSPVDRAWQAALSGAEVVRERLTHTAAGPHEGDLSPLAPLLAERYGLHHIWSSSRLETYAKCPFHFFVTYVLRLEPRDPPREGFDRLILGSIYHRVLEEVYQQAPSSPLSALPDVAQAVFEAAPATYGFRPTLLWKHQQREFLQTLEKTIAALEETREGYEPYAQEPPFGLHGKPPLTLEQIQIRGYIDRVDRAADGSLRVVDYKAGSSRISARELEDGTRLQLPLYALAVQDALGLGTVTAGFYWHIGSASPSYLRLEKHENGVEGAVETAVAHVRAYVASVQAGQFTPTPPAAGCPDHCPAVAFCWQYRSRGW